MLKMPPHQWPALWSQVMAALCSAHQPARTLCPCHSCGRGTFSTDAPTLPWYFSPVLISLCSDRHETGRDQEIRCITDTPPKKEVLDPFSCICRSLLVMPLESPFHVLAGGETLPSPKWEEGQNHIRPHEDSPDVLESHLLH